jgi:hypothetical protein
MALNTNFTAGQILTATQQNNFPRGLVSVTNNTTPSGIVAVETVAVTSPSFTAVANRYYRISYYEPVLQYVSGTVNQVALRIRLTNISGATQQLTEMRLLNTVTGGNNTGFTAIVKTLTAGSTVFVATFAPNGGGSVNCYRAADTVAQLVIEDLGST